MAVTRGKLGMVSVLALGIFLASAVARAETVLRYQFKQGETLPYTMEQKMKMDMKGGGMDVTMDMTQTIDMSWHIQSVDKEGKAKMVQKFDRLRFSMNGPMVKVEYDSKDGKLPEGQIGMALGPILEALAGAEFSLTMDARGQTSDIKIPERLSEAFKKMPGGGGTGGSDLFSEVGINHMIEEVRMTLPEGATTKGQSWTKEVALKMPFGKMKVDNTSTYEGPASRDGKQVEQIALKPKMTMEADGNAGLSAKLKSQDAKGTAYFDNKAGRLVESKMNQTMEMEFSVGGQTINQKVEGTMTVKLKDKEK
jgi:hypothetical protein